MCGDDDDDLETVDYNENAVGRNVAAVADELATRPGDWKLRLRYPRWLVAAAAGEQADVVNDGVVVVRVDLPSAPLQIRTLFVEEDQRPDVIKQKIFY